MGLKPASGEKAGGHKQPRPLSKAARVPTPGSLESPGGHGGEWGTGHITVEQGETENTGAGCNMVQFCVRLQRYA